jgi:hypothetical protein
VHGELQATTGALREALTSSQARGQWGERMAEDVLRAAGFKHGVNYETQRTLDNGARPDVTFLLPGDLCLHMDVKFPLANYLAMLECDAEADREACRKAFLRDVRGRVKELSTRGYVDRAAGTVDCVLLFLPNEHVYGYIHEQDATLLDDALRQSVVLCSPSTLFAVLAVIRQSCDTLALQRTSDEILGLLSGFSDQWTRYTDEVDKLGRQLETVSRTYEQVNGTRRRQLERSSTRSSRSANSVGWTPWWWTRSVRGSWRCATTLRATRRPATTTCRCCRPRRPAEWPPGPPGTTPGTRAVTPTCWRARRHPHRGVGPARGGGGVPVPRRAPPDLELRRGRGRRRAAARTAVWRDARTVKANPDSPQWPVRQRALEDGKTVYMAVPRLAGRIRSSCSTPTTSPTPPRRASSIAGATASARTVAVDDARAGRPRGHRLRRGREDGVGSARAAGSRTSSSPSPPRPGWSATGPWSSPPSTRCRCSRRARSRSPTTTSGST